MQMIREVMRLTLANFLTSGELIEVLSPFFLGRWPCPYLVDRPIVCRGDGRVQQSLSGSCGGFSRVVDRRSAPLVLCARRMMVLLWPQL